MMAIYRVLESSLDQGLVERLSSKRVGDRKNRRNTQLRKISKLDQDLGRLENRDKLH